MQSTRFENIHRIQIAKESTMSKKKNKKPLITSDFKSNK